MLIGVWAGSFAAPAPAELGTLHVTVEVRGAETIDAIQEQAMSEQLVYLNSVDEEVDVVSVDRDEDSMRIVLSGPGELDAEKGAIFNGQRLLIGQKAEIHAGYFAQGTVVEIVPTGN